MKVLVDTHTFIWDIIADHRSSAKAKQVLRSDEHELFFSLVSLWEIAIKIKTGKLNTIGSSVAYIRDEHLLQLESLPHHHSDPFDRLLIAQALTESLPILSGDRAFANYGIKLVW
jgi:PIN domain nuclease of toxin-antitoxin system